MVQVGKSNNKLSLSVCYLLILIIECTALPYHLKKRKLVFSNFRRIFLPAFYKGSYSITVALFLFLTIGFSQEPTIHFTHLSVKDGLSQSDVQGIVKDKYGFMWFATQDGLNKYDGYKFHLYKHSPKNPSGLRSNIVNAIYEDRLGNLWVGTTGGGLSLYNRENDSFTHFLEKPNDQSSISNNSVTCMYEDKLGNFWVGTYWNLNLFDRNTKKFTRFAHDVSDKTTISSDVVLSIAEDSKGRLWIGT